MIIPVLYTEIIILHFPGQSVDLGNVGKGISESNFKIFPGACPQTPLDIDAFGTHVRAYSTHVHLFHPAHESI